MHDVDRCLRVTSWGRPDRVEVGDLVFDVWTTGPAEGEPVLLLHGFPASAATWVPLSSELEGHGLRLLAPHQRGYSPDARPLGVEAYALPHLVADAAALIDAYGLDAAHVVGHDWGAAVAWALAAEHPGRVRTLTAVSVPHLAAYGWALREDADQQRRFAYIGLFRRAGKAETLLLEDGARRLREMYEAAVPAEIVEQHLATVASPEALTAALSWYRAMDATFEELPAVQVPTTYVWSTEDPALGRAGAERCGEFVEAPYELVVLDGVGHWVPEVAPGPLGAAVLRRITA